MVPTVNAYLLDCHTCRHSIGMEDGSGLWCSRLETRPPGMQCRHYEREPGADMPEIEFPVPAATRFPVYLMSVAGK